MKHRRNAFTACVFLTALGLSGCATVIEPSYQVDFRSMALPVMLNDPPKAVQGRTVPISYNFSSASSQSSYSNAYATVTVTTTTTRESGVPFTYQLAMNVSPSDACVFLGNLSLNYHILMMPYYGENSRSLSADALVASKEAMK
jgi:hypothetical protein